MGEAGLYGKFVVYQQLPCGCRSAQCDPGCQGFRQGDRVPNVFVLRPERDLTARAALAHYAERVETTPVLRRDLRGWLDDIRDRPETRGEAELRLPIVVNLRLEGHDVYIGREGRGKDGRLGNPYPRTDPDCLEKCDAYIRHEAEKVGSFRRTLLELWTAPGKRPLRLGCFCVDAARQGKCHGNLIVKWVREHYEEARALWERKR